MLCEDVQRMKNTGKVGLTVPTCCRMWAHIRLFNARVKGSTQWSESHFSWCWSRNIAGNVFQQLQLYMHKLVVSRQGKHRMTMLSSGFKQQLVKLEGMLLLRSTKTGLHRADCVDWPEVTDSSLQHLFTSLADMKDRYCVLLQGTIRPGIREKVIKFRRNPGWILIPHFLRASPVHLMSRIKIPPGLTILYDKVV